MSAPLIDVHSHIYPPALIAYLEARDAPPYIRRVDGVPRFQLFPGDRGVPVTADFTDHDAKLAFMDRSGIAHSVLSPGNPWLDLLRGSESVAIARDVNAEMAETARQDPARTSAMGLLPNDTVADAVAAVEQLAADPGITGVAVGTTICGLSLDSPELTNVWTALGEAALPVFVHPGSGLGAEATRGFGQALTLAMAFPFETTVAIARLVLAGTFERIPGLRVVAAHGGGTLPILAGRLQRALRVDESADPTTRLHLTERAPRLYVDSILFSAPALRLATDVLGSDRVVFGTDHPFPIADAQQAAADLAEAVQGEAYDRVAFGNAAELFGVRLDVATGGRVGAAPSANPLDAHPIAASPVVRGDRP